MSSSPCSPGVPQSIMGVLGCLWPDCHICTPLASTLTLALGLPHAELRERLRHLERSSKNHYNVHLSFHQKKQICNHSLREVEGRNTLILIVSNVLNSYCLYSQSNYALILLWNCIANWGGGGVVVMNTKEKTCKKEWGQHPCNIILQHSFLQRETRPQMLCLLSQGCVERSRGTDRRPSTAWGSFSTHTLSNTRGRGHRQRVCILKRSQKNSVT